MDVDPEALRAARVKAGLTQAELARRVGVAGGERISEWERGRSSPRAATVVRLAAVLGVEMSRLAPAVDDDGLAGLRRRAGLSARELARHSGVPLATVLRWERQGTARRPRASVVTRLAQSLSVSTQRVYAALDWGVEAPDS